MTFVSEDSLKRIAAADDLLVAALARLPSAERMRHAPTVGVVKVLFSGVRKLPPTAPSGADDGWVTLLDKLEPQFDLCENAATVKDLVHRFTVLDERIGRILNDIAALAVAVEPHCPERERLIRLTMLAQQEILMLAGEEFDQKLSHVERALARHRRTDETRTGQFYESLRAFETEFADQADRQATDHKLRAKQWEDDFAVLTGRLKDATHIEQAERIARVYKPAERQERIRVNVYAALCVTFIAIAITAAGFGFYTHRTAPSVAATAGSATLFALLSSAAAIMRRELRVHRDRLWALEDDHYRMMRAILIDPDMTDAQREQFFRAYHLDDGFRGRVPEQASNTQSAKAERSRPKAPAASKKER